MAMGPSCFICCKLFLQNKKLNLWVTIKEQWLDYYVRYQFVEFYRKRMEELQFVQRNLLKALIEEKEKEKEKQDKSLISQLSKTNVKTLKC
jgi:CDP-diacylglycerol pyrophosphatase